MRKEKTQIVQALRITQTVFIQKNKIK